MEKVGQPNEQLLLNLRDEEAQLMQKIQGFMTNGGHEKSAEDTGQTEARLQTVRAKIAELDGGHNGE